MSPTKEQLTSMSLELAKETVKKHLSNTSIDKEAIYELFTLINIAKESASFEDLKNLLQYMHKEELINTLKEMRVDLPQAFIMLVANLYEEAA